MAPAAREPAPEPHHDLPERGAEWRRRDATRLQQPVGDRQNGYRNTATSRYGANNSAGIAQFGANHSAPISQTGNANVAAGVQVGNHCSANVAQTGAGNVAAFVQSCP
jgi:hypothetical protein